MFSQPVPKKLARPGLGSSILRRPRSLPSRPFKKFAQPTFGTSLKPRMLNSLHLPGRPADTRVVVAMSGGVDSSVVAAILKEEGYDVVGITLQLYDHGAMLAKKGACCAGQDIHDARKVAESIGIPHYVLNYESKFREAVMEDFVETYLNGQTPIPCVKCNQ